MKVFDNSFLCSDVKLIAGIDEAGRGPLAGPVVAASVVFSPDICIDRVNDSKLLDEETREELYSIIVEKAICWSVKVIDHLEIDRINILQASLRAMKRSCEALSIVPDLAIVDGNKTFYSKIKTLTIIDGDAKSFCIAAASIIAKVTRDRIMVDYAKDYPVYLWEKNKGYATKEHINALKEHGPCELHRKTFLRNIFEVQNEFEFD